VGNPPRPPTWLSRAETDPHARYAPAFFFSQLEQLEQLKQLKQLEQLERGRGL